mgnify:CR=1 FL=1
MQPLPFSVTSRKQPSLDRSSFCWVSTPAFFFFATLTLAHGAEAGTDFFESKIRPVLVKNCYPCHSAEAGKSKGGLQLDTREGIRTGGDSGPAVVPGELEKSLLIGAIRHDNADLAMPPEKAGGKLPDAVIRDFEAWVKMGAPDPRTGGAKPVAKKYDTSQAKNWWAYQPLQKSPVPSPKDAAWARGDIDRFVLAALEAKGLKPVADAELTTLARRIHFDLTGLPPTPEETDAFLKSAAINRETAIAQLVDRLLASPRFGEHWGRHWLDVARYAESSGRDENVTFPNAWRYRDYVVAALNADKPYDRFVLEQLAGDLLTGAQGDERAQNVIATGFLAIGAKSLNDRVPRQFAVDHADEQINAVGQAFLGQTWGCARCHDHKFDPMSQREYAARGVEMARGLSQDVSARRVHPVEQDQVGEALDALEAGDAVLDHLRDLVLDDRGAGAAVIRRHRHVHRVDFRVLAHRDPRQ